MLWSQTGESKFCHVNLVTKLTMYSNDIQLRVFDCQIQATKRVGCPNLVKRHAAFIT